MENFAIHFGGDKELLWEGYGKSALVVKIGNGSEFFKKLNPKTWS